MNGSIILQLVGITAVLCLIGILVSRRVPKKLKKDVFMTDWKDLQQYCRKRDTWPMALEEADKLLDKALKRRRFKGKTMGERLVSAQRTLTNNDGIWFAHNLYKKTKAEKSFKLKEADIKAALFAYRQALRDIGAILNDK